MTALLCGFLSIATGGLAAADVTLGTWPTSSGPTAANQQYGYPYPNAPFCTASPYNCVADAWNMFQGQCTSWVAYRLNQLNNVSFTNSYRLPRGHVWGNATDWKAAADLIGIPVNGTPAKGSVAWYTATAKNRNDGHVAYVEQVISPTEVVVSEMNIDFSNGFQVRDITTSSGWPTGFIHIADTGDSPNPTPDPKPQPPPQAAVNSTISSSANPSHHGQSVTLTATVAPRAANTNTPSGAVHMFDGSTDIGSGSLSGGAFQVTTSSLSVGTHEITASYGGDSNFLSGGSSTFNQVVSKAETTTTVTSSANPSVFGQPVTFTASVAPTAGSGTPTGTVQFSHGATPIGSGTLSGGTYSITQSSLAVGIYSVTATYGGDDDFMTSNSSQFDQTVNKAPTRTDLAASPAASAGFGDPVTFTATVSVPPPGAGNPTGAVAFSVDGTKVGQMTLTSSLKASLATSALSPGSHTIGATYNGDGNFLASSTTLNYLITCTHTITGSHPGAVIASGASTCILGARVGGAVVVPAGTALAVEHSSVGGAISANSSPHAVQLCGSSVGGAVAISGAQGLVIVGDPGDANCAVNTVNGAMIVRNNTRGVEVIGNTIQGSLIASNNSGPGPYPGDLSSVKGNSKAGPAPLASSPTAAPAVSKPTVARVPTAAAGVGVKSIPSKSKSPVKRPSPIGNLPASTAPTAIDSRKRVGVRPGG